MTGSAFHFDRVAEANSCEDPALPIFNVDVMVEHNPALVLGHLANEMTSLECCPFLSGRQVRQLTPFFIRNVDVVVQMEMVSHEPVQFPRAPIGCGSQHMFDKG